MPLAGRLCRSSLPCAGAEAFPADSERHCNGFPAGAEGGGRAAPWRPLVLLIPLRLGLADVNAAYAGTLKVGLCRHLPSCGRGRCFPEPPAVPSAPWVVPAPPYSGWANPLCGCLLPCCPLRPAWGSREGPAPQGREPRSMRRCSQPRGEPLLTALLPAALLPDAPVPGRDRREAQQCPLLHRLRW